MRVGRRPFRASGRLCGQQKMDDRNSGESGGASRGRRRRAGIDARMLIRAQARPFVSDENAEAAARGFDAAFPLPPESEVAELWLTEWKAEHAAGAERRAKRAVRPHAHGMRPQPLAVRLRALIRSALEDAVERMNGADQLQFALIPLNPVRIVLALSGGRDSMAMLDVLSRLRADARQAIAGEVCAVYVHHGLSPHAAQWEEHCRKACEARGVGFESIRVQVRNTGEGIEAAARSARYRALADFALRGGYDVVMTAHHEDDRIETFLMQWMRGSGLEGLAAFPKTRSLEASAFVHGRRTPGTVQHSGGGPRNHLPLDRPGRHPLGIRRGVPPEILRRAVRRVHLEPGAGSASARLRHDRNAGFRGRRRPPGTRGDSGGRGGTARQLHPFRPPARRARPGTRPPLLPRRMADPVQPDSRQFLSLQPGDGAADALVGAERVVLKDFERKELFSACQPAEEVARTGRDAIRFGAMKPVGLIDPRTGRRPWAAVQLRAENAERSAYNLVGFQTNLTFSEQRRVFRMIPGLEHAEFFRYGVMHRNTFVDSPHVLDATFCIPGTHVRLAGQITGTEGYTEAIASGLLAALNTYADLTGAPSVALPRTGAFGALVAYATDPATQDYQPMHVNFGLVPTLEDGVKRSKRDRYARYAERAIDDLDAYIATRRDLFASRGA